MRLAYELAVGKRVSDNHWYCTRKLLEQHNLEVTVKNVQFFVQLKALIPRSAIGVAGLLDAYNRAEQLVSKTKKNFTGGQITTLLRQFGVDANQSTISRWFKPLGGYKRTKEYKPEQLRDLLVRAFLYKAQYGNHSDTTHTISLAS